MWKIILVVFSCALVLCCGQRVQKASPQIAQGQKTLPKPQTTNDLHVGLTEGIGNFSLELLYHTSKQLPKTTNLILSPFTVWTSLAIINEGAAGMTARQIRNATRISGPKTVVREDFGNIAGFLQGNTSTIELSQINAIFVNSDSLLEADFQDTADKYYQTKVAPVNFTDGKTTAAMINNYVSHFTHGRIPKIVESDYFDQTQMILVSGVYFKGQWTSPFNRSLTEKKAFYTENGQRMGEVNMMYNRYNYPFANIKELQARVIEIPYGKENRLSMLVMLPNPNVTLEGMFLKFATVPLDKVFTELKISKMEYGDDEVDCFLPRFKIESNLQINQALIDMGIHDLFDPLKARLPHLARVPLYVTRVIHKAEIEVTEEGTTASAVTATEFANRIGVVRFEANRPFAYLIVEKITNSIVFGGVYKEPSLY